MIPYCKLTLKTINSTPEEDRPLEAISIVVQFQNNQCRELLFLRAFDLSFGRLSQHQPQEQQRRRYMRQRTPGTSLSAPSFSNCHQSYEIRVSTGKSSGKILAV